MNTLLHLRTTNNSLDKCPMKHGLVNSTFNFGCDVFLEN